MAVAGRSDRLSLRAGAEPRQDFPSGEAADELGMVRVGDVSEMADQPPLERADLLVDGGEHAAGHQEFPQVAGRPPELEGVECLSLIHISEPTRQAEISYAVFCLKKKKN